MISVISKKEQLFIKTTLENIPQTFSQERGYKFNRVKADIEEISSQLINYNLEVSDYLREYQRGVFGGGVVGLTIINVINYITISNLGNSVDFGDLTAGRRDLAATSNGTNDRGVFGGGNNGTVNLNIIDYITINSAGEHSDFGDLIVETNFLSSTSNGTNERGVFSGGIIDKDMLQYITISTLGNASLFGNLSVERFSLVSTSNRINERGVFAGGLFDSTIYQYNTIDYITISTIGNAIDFGDLTVARRSLTATSNGTNERGVFGGGSVFSTTWTYYNTIDYLTISNLGNSVDFGDLSSVKSHISAASNGINDRGVFGGGNDGTITINTIEYITISVAGNALDFGDLSIETYALTSTSNAD